MRSPHSSEQPQRVLLSLLVQQASLLPGPAAGRAQGRLYVVFYQTYDLTQKPLVLHVWESHGKVPPLGGLEDESLREW